MWKSSITKSNSHGRHQIETDLHSDAKEFYSQSDLEIFESPLDFRHPKRKREKRKDEKSPSERTNREKKKEHNTHTQGWEREKESENLEGREVEWKEVMTFVEEKIKKMQNFILFRVSCQHHTLSSLLPVHLSSSLSLSKISVENLNGCERGLVSVCPIFSPFHKILYDFRWSNLIFETPSPSSTSSSSSSTCTSSPLPLSSSSVSPFSFPSLPLPKSSHSPSLSLPDHLTIISQVIDSDSLSRMSFLVFDTRTNRHLILRIYVRDDVIIPSYLLVPHHPHVRSVFYVYSSVSDVLVASEVCVPFFKEDEHESLGEMERKEKYSNGFVKMHPFNQNGGEERKKKVLMEMKMERQMKRIAVKEKKCKLKKKKAASRRRPGGAHPRA